MCLTLHKAGKCSHTWPPTSKSTEQPECRLAEPACSGCARCPRAALQPLNHWAAWQPTHGTTWRQLERCLANKVLTDRVCPDEGAPHGGHGVGAPGQLHPQAACRPCCPCKCLRGSQVGSWGLCASNAPAQGVVVGVGQLDCLALPGAATASAAEAIWRLPACTDLIPIRSHLAERSCLSVSVDLVLLHTHGAGSSCPANKKGGEMQLADSAVEVGSERPVWNAGSALWRERARGSLS